MDYNEEILKRLAKQKNRFVSEEDIKKEADLLGISIDEIKNTPS